MDRVSMEAAAVDAAAAVWKAAGQPYRHLTRQALKAAGKTEAMAAVATVTAPATADPDVCWTCLATIIRHVLPQRQGWHPAGQVDWPKVLRQAPPHRITWALETDRDWQARSR